MKILLHSNGPRARERTTRLRRITTGIGAKSPGSDHHRVNVYFHDRNGPKGGCDKTCRLVIHLRRRPPVVIQEQDAELSPLIYRLLERAGQTLQRRSTNRRERTNPISMSGE